MHFEKSVSKFGFAFLRTEHSPPTSKILKIKKCKKITCNSSIVERTNVNVERRTMVREKIAKPLNSNKNKDESQKT